MGRLRPALCEDGSFRDRMKEVDIPTDAGEVRHRREEGQFTRRFPEADRRNPPPSSNLQIRRRQPQAKKPAARGSFSRRHSRFSRQFIGRAWTEFDAEVRQKLRGSNPTEMALTRREPLWAAASSAKTPALSECFSTPARSGQSTSWPNFTIFISSNN